MTCNGELFNEQNPMKLEEFVAIVDDTLYLITHVGNVSLRLESGEQNTLGGVLHVNNFQKFSLY